MTSREAGLRWVARAQGHGSDLARRNLLRTTSACRSSSSSHGAAGDVPAALQLRVRRFDRPIDSGRGRRQVHQLTGAGLLIQVATFGSGQTAIGLTEDLSKGVIDRFRSAPDGRSAVLGGRTLSDLIRNAFRHLPDARGGDSEWGSATRRVFSVRGSAACGPRVRVRLVVGDGCCRPASSGTRRRPSGGLSTGRCPRPVCARQGAPTAPWLKTSSRRQAGTPAESRRLGRLRFLTSRPTAAITTTRRTRTRGPQAALPRDGGNSSGSGTRSRKSHREHQADDERVGG